MWGNGGWVRDHIQAGTGAWWVGEVSLWPVPAPVHRGAGATIRCSPVVIGANQGDGGVGGGLRAYGEVGDGSGTTFMPAGARGGSVR